VARAVSRADMTMISAKYRANKMPGVRQRTVHDLSRLARNA
jgi:hypothetical protein